ncbi:MAG: bis(5'-nucleosyl)-tetraphosphatase (symmetrical) YqeK [Bacillota bacterium]|jgi:predicted HD superfamily hydrolase involved in NAD metabolism|nr:bis(5'-nucleosyl)-tetraphosphatase (symmetrical) YqeK [Bacillota bacterium]NLV61852.1 HD domain-containing protein [Clostridiaceae bacterium]
MTFDKMRENLKLTLSRERFRHSEEVMNEALRLAEFYKVNIEKARIAGLLHDCARDAGKDEIYKVFEKYNVVLDDIQKKTPVLLHSILGSFYAREYYGVEDKEILDAIYWHTTGRAGMTMLEKIIFVADYIESGRNFEGVEEARKQAYKDIERCIVICCDLTIRYILQKGKLLHPYIIETRNEAITQIEAKKLNLAQTE